MQGKGVSSAGLLAPVVQIGPHQLLVQGITCQICYGTSTVVPQGGEKSVPEPFFGIIALIQEEHGDLPAEIHVRRHDGGETVAFFQSIQGNGRDETVTLVLRAGQIMNLCI